MNRSFLERKPLPNSVRFTDTLSLAYTRNPERFVRKHPEPPALPTIVWINKPEKDTDTTHSTNP